MNVEVMNAVVLVVLIGFAGIGVYCLGYFKGIASKLKEDLHELLTIYKDQLQD